MCEFLMMLENLFLIVVVNRSEEQGDYKILFWLIWVNINFDDGINF